MVKLKLRIKRNVGDIIGFLNVLSASGYYFNTKLENVGQDIIIDIKEKDRFLNVDENEMKNHLD